MVPLEAGVGGGDLFFCSPEINRIVLLYLKIKISFLIYPGPQNCLTKVDLMIQRFRTDRSGQTVQTQSAPPRGAV